MTVTLRELGTGRVIDTKLAQHIARAIFACGDESKRKVYRIQFKAGQFGYESDLGGLCETALVSVIHAALRDYGKSP